ncbi:MAG: sigma-70 family RNA polymerase sigma factor [Phycisphaerae bacterium]|nr:sigma-70 family RNA polymerase sigma factor [Phycisphaerae bacterium]
MDLTRTTTALLEGLHDTENEPAWEAFDARYRPILVGFARNLGLPDADAADIAQETLVRFVQDYRQGKYDRTKGRLGAWLVGIARYRILDLHRARAHRHEVQGDSSTLNPDDADGMQRVWDAEHRQAILREAMRELRQSTKTDERTIRAFELVAAHDRSPQQVAEELGMSVHDVYLAKSRVAQRLREIVERLEKIYEEGT